MASLTSPALRCERMTVENSGAYFQRQTPLIRNSIKTMSWHQAFSQSERVIYSVPAETSCITTEQNTQEVKNEHFFNMD